MFRRRTLTALAFVAAAAVAVPTSAASSAAPAPAGTSTPATIAAYQGTPADQAATKAFYDAVMKSALAKQAKSGNKLEAVTVRYSTSRAPSFRSQIASSTRIWNSSVRNVQLAESTSGYDFEYREGNDSRGSYAYTDGHGRGYIFLDYRQNQIYNSTRVTSHETGHVLGLPDHYSGPCSELMSGGGPGPSCTNAVPNSAERSRVERLWANGLAGLGEAAFKTIK